MTRDEWLQLGFEKGFCSGPVCLTCDSFPTSAEEDRQEASEVPPCMYMVRLYNDEDHRKAVEANHAPSVWRGTNESWKRP